LVGGLEKWDPKLFETTSWNDTPNIAGAYPEENGQYLFPMERYRDRIQAALDYPVFFGAVIGVPDVSECRGDMLTDKGCLDLLEMEVALDDASSDEMTGALVPACTRPDNGSGRVISAAPGRRHVELAEQLQGYIVSIRSDDMDTVCSIAMTMDVEIANSAAEPLTVRCPLYARRNRSSHRKHSPSSRPTVGLKSFVERTRRRTLISDVSSGNVFRKKCPEGQRHVSTPRSCK
jgi:hypothetical protein